MKKNKWKVSLFLLLFLLLVLTIIKSTSDRSVEIEDNKQKNSSNKSWKKLLDSCPLPNNASMLNSIASFSEHDNEKSGKYLNTPTCLCVDSKGNIFVSDMYDHSVHKYDNKGNFIKKIGRGGQAPGELLMPNYIDTDNSNNLLVYDAGNSRIQIFNSNGEYAAGFKLFKPYQSMAVDGAGLVYMSPLTSDISWPIIEVLNTDGNIIASFGKRINFKNNTIAHNQVTIDINKRGEIVVAWRYFPIVRRYCKDGNMLAENMVRYRLLNKLAEPNYRAKVKNASIKMTDVITRIRSFEDRYYLFIRYPRIELLEMNLNGQVNKIYYKNETYEYTAKDFIARESNNKIELFYVLSAYPKQTIDALSVRAIF